MEEFKSLESISMFVERKLKEASIPNLSVHRQRECGYENIVCKLKTNIGIRKVTISVDRKYDNGFRLHFRYERGCRSEWVDQIIGPQGELREALIINGILSKASTTRIQIENQYGFFCYRIINYLITNKLIVAVEFLIDGDKGINCINELERNKLVVKDRGKLTNMMVVPSILYGVTKYARVAQLVYKEHYQNIVYYEIPIDLAIKLKFFHRRWETLRYEYVRLYYGHYVTKDYENETIIDVSDKLKLKRIKQNWCYFF